MENVRKQRDIKLVTTNKRRNQLVSEPDYHITQYIIGLSILEISKTLMYEFWYDYMKQKYGDNVKLCYMDTDIADHVEKRFDTSNYKCDRSLPKERIKK